MANILPTEFIKTFLIDDVGRMVEPFPYQAFMIMASGIEFLGKCLSPVTDWNKPKESQKDFNYALKHLVALKKYSQLNTRYKFYSLFRCGLLHSLAPKSDITLSSKNELGHLIVDNGKLNLKCEDFYSDFKNACEEVINKQYPYNNKFLKEYLAVPGDNDSISTSGTTANPPIRIITP